MKVVRVDWQTKRESGILDAGMPPVTFVFHRHELTIIGPEVKFKLEHVRSFTVTEDEVDR